MNSDNCYDRKVISDDQKALLCYGWDRFEQTIYNGFCAVEYSAVSKGQFPTIKETATDDSSLIILEMFYTVMKTSGISNSHKIGNYQVLNTSSQHINIPKLSLNTLLADSDFIFEFDMVKNTKEELLPYIQQEKQRRLEEIERYYRTAIDICSEVMRKTGIEQTLNF